LNVDAAIAILFGISSPADDSFITTLRYARNEGMLEQLTMILAIQMRAPYFFNRMLLGTSKKNNQ